MEETLRRRKTDDKMVDCKQRAIGAYQEALQCLSAAEKMDEQRCQWQLISPTITIGALACELFSKSILYTYIQRGEVKGHRLKALYDEFPQHIKSPLSDHISDKQRFEDYISDISEIFEVWRYCFEYQNGSSHYSFILEYGKALEKICKERLQEIELFSD